RAHARLARSGAADRGARRGLPRGPEPVRRVALVTLVLALSLPWRAGAEPIPLRADHVLLVTLPAVTWGEVVAAKASNLLFVADRGATAALAPRAATVIPGTEQGYLTLAAGNRIEVGPPELAAARQVVASTDALEGVEARTVLSGRIGRHRDGEAVMPGVAQ